MAHVRNRLGENMVSERRACKTLGQPRSTQRYKARRPDLDRILLEDMNDIVKINPRYGCARVHQELLKRGWRVNLKRVHRLWKQEHFHVPRKQHKKGRLPGTSANSCDRRRAEHVNHVWSYDFVSDRTEDGRQLRLLTVIDEYTRECLAIGVGRHFTSEDVKIALLELFCERGCPDSIRSDNGSEFIAKPLRKWLRLAPIETLYVQKGSPWENGYIESFNGKLRDELLNGELFINLLEARYMVEAWRIDYNEDRPHSSLGWQTPAAYAASLADPPVGASPLPAALPAKKLEPILS